MFLLPVLFAMLATSATPFATLCPSKCSCFLDARGRNTVQCKEGGYTGPLTLTNVSKDTEILKITPPEDNMNVINMSPVLHEYKKLEEIYITRSNIPQLGTLFFYGLDKLDILDLSQNNITQPLDSNFRGLDRLKELYLDDNRIVSLPSGTFRYVHELKVLSIQRNRITRLMPRIFLEIGKLKVLRMSGNHLMELNPVVFEDVQELRTLECRSCGLKKMDKRVYELLHHLAYLDLGDNKLTYLSSEEFEPLANLRVLKLDGNHITAIKALTFTSQHELKRLNLARNDLTKISPGAFDSLRNLTELDLGHNRLEVPESTVLEPVASTLEILVLNGNRFSLRSLKTILDSLQVRELFLAECGLVELVEGVIPKEVEVLSLASNHLSDLSSAAIPIGLTELDLSGNRFFGLEDDILQRIEVITNLHLDRNPWSCDLCYIVPLLERVNKSAAIRDVKCAAPFTQKGKKLGILRKEELTWCTVPNYNSGDANYFLLGDDGRIGLIAAGASVFLLLLTVLAIVAVVLYSRRHAAKYYTHEDKLAIEGDTFFENHSPLFGDERELSFKFPLNDKKLSIATIDEIKKEHTITNGT